MNHKNTATRMAIAAAAASALPLLTIGGTAVHAAVPNPPSASTLVEASAETLLKWADAGRSRGDCAYAINLYGQVLEQNPHNAAALMGRGKAYLARREFDKALADYNKATQAAPHSADAFYGRATVRLMMREQEEQAAAISAGGEGTATTSDSPSVSPSVTAAPVLDGSQFDKEGTVRSCELPALDAAKQKERTGQIIADLDKAAQLNPKLASVWYRKAAVCEAAGRKTEAITAYNEFLSRSTNKSSLAWTQAHVRLASLEGDR